MLLTCFFQQLRTNIIHVWTVLPGITSEMNHARKQ